jgi:hypothetical protein
MSDDHLRPCPSCARHARVSERACPFCRATFDAAFRTAVRPKPPSQRLARAALFSLGTTTVAFAPGCALVPQDKSEGPNMELQPFPPDATAGEGDASLLGGTFYGSAIAMEECTTVEDCSSGAIVQGASGLPFCCFLETCLVGTSTSAVGCADPQVQQISAANYDQTCDADTDCVAVAEGDFCVPGAGNCPNAAINKGALGRYQSDIANTNAAFCRAPGSCGVGTACGNSVGPWCLNGTCETTTCPPDGVATDAGATDAGAGDGAAGDAQNLDGGGYAEDADTD